MRSICLVLVVVLLGLGGCAANVKKSAEGTPLHVAAESKKSIAMHLDGSKITTEAGDWIAFKGEWRAAMRKAADAHGIAYDDDDSATHPSVRPGTLVEVYINDYRYISPGARYGFGIMTGNAYVDAKVRFSDLGSTASYGERKYDTTSTAWQGIFSAMTEKQVQAICKEMVDAILAP